MDAHTLNYTQTQKKTGIHSAVMSTHANTINDSHYLHNHTAHSYSDHFLIQIRNFVARGRHSLLWPVATTFL